MVAKKKDETRHEILTVEQLCSAPMLYEGERVITFGAIDQVHQKAEGSARVAFNRHKERFKLGVHYRLAPAEFGRISEIRPNGRRGGNRKPVIVLTRRGYLLLAKVFDDDKAWEVQDMLVECYFILDEQRQQANPPGIDFQALIVGLVTTLDGQWSQRMLDMEERIMRATQQTHDAFLKALAERAASTHPDCPAVNVMQFIRESWQTSTAQQRQAVLDTYNHVIEEDLPYQERLRARPQNDYRGGPLYIPGQYVKHLSRAIIRTQQDLLQPGDFGPLFGMRRMNAGAN